MVNMDNLLDVFQRGTLAPMGRLGRMAFDVPADVIERDNEYVIHLSVGGFKKENISVNYKNGILSISGTAEVSSDNEETGKYIIKERSSSKFERSFAIDGIDETNISAKMEDGVLTITLPKTEEEAPSTISIE